MKSTFGIVGLAAACCLASAVTAEGRGFIASRSSGNSYGGWGGYSDYQPLPVINNPLPDIAAQNRELSQKAAMGQNYVMQSGIRGALTSQANAETAATLARQQANQDWWFQYQGQMAAERRTRGDDQPVAVAYAAPVGGLGLAPPRPKVALDVIRWPRALQGPEFASRRTIIEAPYRRTPPKLSTPSTADYRTMIQTVKEMQAILEWRLTEDNGLATEDYNEAKACLEKIGQEAARRAAEPRSSTR